MRYTIFDNMAQCTEQEVQRLLPLVPAFRREYALRYRHVFGQFCTLQSWLMLEDLLQQFANRRNNKCDSTQQLPSGKHQCAAGAPCYGKYGKPYIPGFPEFSISHCKTAIAVAVDEEPVGIDIENIRHADDALLAHTMNEKEIAQIRQAEVPDRMFTQLWTQKEAYLKCLGTGITDDLPHVLEHADPSRFTLLLRDKYIVSIYHHNSPAR
ncbi:MAG: 4'-phosphopantetheinyl transferase superfamily protein [Bacteroidales bacterium]|nr:4'-phosphopantetheinyl transferase superfamily protein [Bacteroidales bacterium]